MKYPDALAGVKRIRTSMFMRLAVSVLTAAAVMPAGSNDGAVAWAAAIVLWVFAAAMAVVEITGAARAARDDPAFKKALVPMIAGPVIGSLWTAIRWAGIPADPGFIPAADSAISFTVKILECLSAFFVCAGVVCLADRMGDTGVSAQGKRVQRLYLVFQSGYGCVKLVRSAIGADTGSSAAVLAVSTVFLLCSAGAIAAVFMHLGLLGRAKAMLEKQGDATREGPGRRRHTITGR